MSDQKDSKRTTRDPFEDTLEAAHSLMRKRRGEEACQLLEEAKSRALELKELDHAALYSSVRGSYLRAIEKNEDALNSYMEAERYSGGEIQSQLITARHLVNGMEQPKAALDKIEVLLEDKDLSAGAHSEALAIRGAAFLELGDVKRAVSDLAAMSAELSQQEDYGVDLTLVERFIRRGVALDECLKFLTIAESKAMRPEEERTLLRIRKLKLRLQ